MPNLYMFASCVFSDDAEEKRDVEDFKEMVMRAFEEEMTE